MIKNEGNKCGARPKCNIFYDAMEIGHEMSGASMRQAILAADDYQFNVVGKFIKKEGKQTNIKSKRFNLR